jgi:hypothetical protein
MQRTIFGTLAALVALAPAPAAAQTSTKAATYITDEEVKTVNKEPGIDRTIRVVDIGNEHFAVGIIHRVATTASAGRATAPAASAPAGEPCGEAAAAAAAGTATGISHDSQTEGYLIVSGGGTLVTGGHIANGRKSSPDSDVTKILNGPSCSGSIVGADVVKRAVKVGDIVIIPAGVPHGWSDIPDHVDYLSFRPSDHVLQAGYVHPSIQK